MTLYLSARYSIRHLEFGAVYATGWPFMHLLGEITAATHANWGIGKLMIWDAWYLSPTLNEDSYGRICILPSSSDIFHGTEYIVRSSGHSWASERLALKSKEKPNQVKQRNLDTWSLEIWSKPRVSGNLRRQPVFLAEGSRNYKSLLNMARLPDCWRRWIYHANA